MAVYEVLFSGLKLDLFMYLVKVPSIQALTLRSENQNQKSIMARLRLYSENKTLHTRIIPSMTKS